MITYKHKSLLFSCVLLLTSFTFFSKQPSDKIIWKGDSHAAFTALVEYQDTLYCAFRNANMHADISGNDCGVIKIIRSGNGEKWEDYLTFTESGYDLRDPQLSVTPVGEMMLLTEKVKYENGKAITRNTCVSFIKSKRQYTPLQSVTFDVSQNWNWIWNVEWIDGVAYGFCYAPFFGMVKSSDGINYDLVDIINLQRNPSEGSIAKLNSNHYLAVVRTDGVAYLGIYDVNEGKWRWKDCDEMIACPKVINYKNKVYVVGRSYIGGLKTSVYKFNKRNKELRCLVRLSGGKDCSYPGLVYHDGKLYVSYYKGDGSSSDIYLATIKF